jgi:dethiobiotin synthetase
MPVAGLYLVAASPRPGKTTVGAAITAALHRGGLRVCAAKPIELGCAPLPSILPDATGQPLDEPALGSLARLRALAGPPPATTFASLSPEQLEPRDSVLLRAASSTELPLAELSPCRFAPELDPAVAARVSGRAIELEAVIDSVARLRERAELVILEGTGGLCSPLGERALELDLVAALRLPVLLIAPSAPGCVHATLSSLELLRARALACAGVVLNRLTPRPSPEEAAHPYEIERFAGPLVRGVMPFLEELERSDLDRLARRAALHLDLEAIVARALPLPAPLP